MYRTILIGALAFSCATAFLTGCDSKAPNTKALDLGTPDSLGTSSTTGTPGSSDTAGTTGTSGSDDSTQNNPKPAMSNHPPTDPSTTAIIKTNLGDIDIQFYPEKAPKSVANFLKLAKEGFYDGTKFHRTIPGFMIQGGDPNTKGNDTSTWGQGGSGKNVPAEFNDIPFTRSILGMARSSDPNSGSSQFFIMVADAPHLNGQYTAFGAVTKGMDVVDKIVNLPKTDSDPSRAVDPAVIEKVTIENTPKAK